MNTADHTPLLRIDEVAAILSVRERTVRNWCRQGLLKHIRLPHGNYRIPVAELERLTKGHHDVPKS